MAKVKKTRKRLDELEAVLTLTPEDEAEEAAAETLEDVLAALEVEVEGSEEDGGEMDDEEMDDEEMEMDGEGDEEESDQFGESSYLDDTDEMSEMGCADDDDDEIVEIDENMLRTELKRLKRIRESKNSRSRRSRRRAQPRTSRANINKKSRNNRALKGKLVETLKLNRGLKKQLVETNLFNAKLLYTYKMTANHKLSNKEKRAIVEAFDKSTSVKEVELAYKTFSAFLTKKGKTSLKESNVRTRGSSSKIIGGSGSAKTQVREEDRKVQRWGKLAGISEESI